MKQPTREELGPLVENARWWLSRSLGASPFSVEEGDRLTERTIALLDAYPLPPEDGERAQLATDLEDDARLLMSAADEGLSVDYVRVKSGDLEKAARRCARAAALLRQPPPAPVAGVSKAAVLSLVQRFGSEAMTDAPAPGLRPMTGYDFTQVAGRLVSDIEALPEAAPRPALAEERKT